MSGVVLMLLFVPAQDAVILRQQYREGARYRFERTISTEVGGEQRIGGRAAQEVRQRTDSTTVYIERMVRVANGEPAEAERTYESYTETRRDLLSGIEERLPTSLPGRTLRLVRQGSRTMVDYPVEVRASDTEGITLPSCALARCYPNEPVRPGAEWEVTTQALLDLLELNPRMHAVSRLDARARFDRIERIEGAGDCALVVTEGRAELTTREGATIAAQFRVREWLAPAGHPARVAAEITLHVRQQAEREGVREVQDATVRTTSDTRITLLEP